eukprot:6087146-Amphidinium_carterae.1
MEQTCEEDALCAGSGISSSHDHRDEGVGHISKEHGPPSTWDTHCSTRGGVSASTPEGLARIAEGGERSTVCTCDTPSEGECVNLVVPVPPMPSEIPTRERGVHWPIGVSLDDMLCDWVLPSVSDSMRLDHIRAKEDSPTALRCQFGHCPSLPWVVHGLHAIEMGYTGKLRCLGYTTQGLEVDSDTIPESAWQGLILLERQSLATLDPPTCVSPPQIPDAEHVWLLMDKARLGEHCLRDMSRCILWLPQRKLPALPGELDIHVQAYQVVLALAETDTGWQWDFEQRPLWPIEGRRKQKTHVTEKIVMGCILTSSPETAQLWVQLLKQTQPTQWTEQHASWVPVPGLSVYVASMWKGDIEFTDFSVPLSTVVIFHSFPPEVLLDALRDKHVLVAVSMPMSEQQAESLTTRGYYASKCMLKGETTTWCVASRPANLAIQLELAGEFGLDAVIRSVWHVLVQECSMEEEVPVSCLSASGVNLAEYSWRELVDEIVTFFHSHTLPLNSARTGVGDQNTTECSDGLRTLTLGATTARKYGVTPNTTQLPWRTVLPLILELARRRPAECQHPFLSIAITTGAVSAHEDFNDSLTSLISLGSFHAGGELLLEDTLVNTRETWRLMDARQTHQVLPYEGGCRFAIACYCPRNAHKLPPHAFALLRRLDFPVSWWAAERCWQQVLWSEDMETHVVSTGVQKLTEFPEGIGEEGVEQVTGAQGPSSGSTEGTQEESILDSGDRVFPPVEVENTANDIGGLQEHEIEVLKYWPWMGLPHSPGPWSVKRRLSRAATARTRANQEQFRVGDVVFILRQPRVGNPHRLGPGTVVMCSGGTAW